MTATPAPSLTRSLRMGWSGGTTRRWRCGTLREREGKASRLAAYDRHGRVRPCVDARCAPRTAVLHAGAASGSAAGGGGRPRHPARTRCTKSGWRRRSPHRRWRASRRSRSGICSFRTSASTAKAGLWGTGRRAVFPVWGVDTAKLARQFIAAGFRAILVCVDPRALDGSFAGREFDESWSRIYRRRWTQAGRTVSSIPSCTTARILRAGWVSAWRGGRARWVRLLRSACRRLLSYERIGRSVAERHDRRVVRALCHSESARCSRAPPRSSPTWDSRTGSWA